MDSATGFFLLLSVWFFVWLAVKALGSLLGWSRKPRPKPPTERQLNYIAVLLDERETDDLEFVDPLTIEEASALITYLKKLPYRDDDDDDDDDD